MGQSASSFSLIIILGALLFILLVTAFTTCITCKKRLQPHNEPHWRSTRLRHLQRKPTESESSSRRDPPPEYLHVIEEKRREEEELPTYSEALAVETDKCESLENEEYRCRKSEA